MKILPRKIYEPRIGWKWIFEGRVYKIIGERIVVDDEYWLVDYIVQNGGDLRSKYPYYITKESIQISFDDGTIQTA